MGGQWRGRGAAADAREYLRRVAGTKREGLGEPNRNKKREGSINPYRFTITLYTLTFVTCITGPVGQDCDLG